MIDPYRILGVAPSSSLDTIKSAYRALAKKFHPDINQNNPAAAKHFRAVVDAYQYLIHATPEPQAPPQQEKKTKTSSPPPPPIMKKFLLRISFLEAVHGTEKRVHGQRVTVPRGTENGHIIVINTYPKIHIKIVVDPHPFFTRKKDDIYMDLPISLHEAVKGGRIEIPTIHGPVTFTLPPHSANKTFRLKGKGLCLGLLAHAGHHIVTPYISLPDSLQSYLEYIPFYNPRKNIQKT